MVKTSKKANIFAFIVCFFLAFCIWLYVMNMENGDYTKTFTLSIEVVGEEVLFEKTGLRLFDDSATATTANVTVQGTKADVQKYKEQDFRAYIDVSGLTEAGKATVGISVETPTSAVKVMSSDPMTVKVYADYENTVTVELRVSNPNPEVKKFEATATSVVISGPESFVNQVQYVQAQLPVDRYEEGDTVELTNLRVYGEKNLPLSMLNLTVEPDTVVITVLTVENSDE